MRDSEYLRDAPVKAVYTSLQLGRRCDGMSPEEVSEYNMDGTLRLVDTLRHAALVRSVSCGHALLVEMSTVPLSRPPVAV